jgi:Fe-S protein assembly co-chaperone HscB
MDPMNAFEILGFEPSMDIDADELEAAYLRLSREYHPDFNLDCSEDERIAVLTRAADLNDAYRELRDPWLRAERIVELEAEGSLELTKKLSPVFLMQAMEIAEQCDSARGAAARELSDHIRANLDDYLERITRAIAARDFQSAAVWLNEARYFRKARQNLDEDRSEP